MTYQHYEKLVGDTFFEANLKAESKYGKGNFEIITSKRIKHSIYMGFGHKEVVEVTIGIIDTHPAPRSNTEAPSRPLPSVEVSAPRTVYSSLNGNDKSLQGFDGSGDRFTLSATAGKGATQLELRDAQGVLRYSAAIEPSSTLASAERLNGTELAKSPWETSDIYSPKTLFHGQDFQVIQSIEGLSTKGARATLSGTSSVGWPSERWETDPAAVDGALQLAILCGLHAIGQTLPLRIGKIGYTGASLQGDRGPIRCALLVRKQTPEQVICDITLAGSDGTPIVDLVDVEMYKVPSGTTANVATA